MHVAMLEKGRRALHHREGSGSVHVRVYSRSVAKVERERGNIDATG